MKKYVICLKSGDSITGTIDLKTALHLEETDFVFGDTLAFKDTESKVILRNDDISAIIISDIIDDESKEKYYQ